MSLIKRVLEMADHIQQTPAPTFQENQRAEMVHALFQTENLQQVHVDVTGNVYACLSGQDADAPPVVVSAHLDTVFPVETDLGLQKSAGRWAGPGIGDNSLGVAGLFGLLWMIRVQSLVFPGDLWLVANVCEEGLGNLRGMQAVVDHFKASPRAYIILEGMGLGTVYHRGLGVQRYRVTIQTQGGHSWAHAGRPSAIHELAEIMVRLKNLPLSEQPRTTLNIGVVGGGTSINTIASQAWFELDLRSESAATLTALADSMQKSVEQIQRDGVTVSIEQIGNRPMGEIPQNHWLPALAAQCLQQQGISPKFSIGSTDANMPLSRGYPAVCVGLTQGGGAHSLSEFILLKPVSQGLEALFSLASGVFES